MDAVNTVLKFDIEGLPIAQGRARAVLVGNPENHRILFHDPKRSKVWKTEVLRQAIDQQGAYLRLLERQGIGIHRGPIAIDMYIRLPRPKKLPKRIRSHVKKPDLSNLIKGVEDALEGWLYKNDSQICRMIVFKNYALPGEKVGLAMEVKLWEE